MEKRSDNTVFDFAETIKDKYPHLTKDQIYAICRSPFKLVATEMKKGSLKDIRIKYLGTFCVFPGRVKGLVNVMTKSFAEGKITEPTLNTYQRLSEEYSKLHNLPKLPTNENVSLD